jgi:hypothetical protein
MADHPLPPPEIQEAARRVQSYLDSQTFAARVKAAAQPDARGDGRVSDEAYRAMSPAQRLDYSRQFDQSQFNNNKQDTRHG